MTTPVRKHLVTIQGATPDVQHWVDAFVTSARTGTGAWPHQHDAIPMTFVPLDRFTRVMEQVGWSLTTQGPVAREAPVSPVPDPNDGSIYHDVLHGLLGDFHRPRGDAAS